MKIIFICTKPITFNIFLKAQADYLIKKGLNVEIASSDIKNIKFNDDLKYRIDFPIKIIELFNLFRYIRIFKQIRNLVIKNPAAIFYLHTPVAAHIFRIFNFFNKLKIIYFVHGFRFVAKTNLIKKTFFKIIEKILSLKTDIFITINNEDYNYSRSILKKKSSCYKINGIGLDLLESQLKKKLKNKKEIKKILVIAAYKKEKGYLEILKVAEMIKNLKIKIECYGEGQYYQFDRIRVKKKLKNIFFKNFDVNLSKKIKKYDILLHLSKREGLPVSIMQSLTEGLPVICYNIRGNNDLIKDNFNGFLVKSYKDVLNKIHYLNLDKFYFNKMRYNALKTINKHFLKKKVNSKIYNIIKKLSKYS